MRYSRGDVVYNKKGEEIVEVHIHVEDSLFVILKDCGSDTNYRMVHIDNIIDIATYRENNINELGM